MKREEIPVLIQLVDVLEQANNKMIDANTRGDSDSFVRAKKFASQVIDKIGETLG